jgi:hypothetical protein
VNLDVRRLLLSLLLVLLPTEMCLAAGDIYQTLVEQGVSLGGQETIKLPQPVLADGLDAAQQRQAIEALLAGRYDWDAFTRKSVVSPLLLKIGDGEPKAGQVSRRVDLYFIAYGELDLLRDDEKLQEHLNLASAGDVEADGRKMKVLSADELQTRGLPTAQGIGDPRWVAIETTLLGKVQLNLTTRNEKAESEETLVLASILDPKFQSDAEYPNAWRSITIDDAGRRQIGSSQPYPGLGSYVKATRLVEPQGAVFIEYHLVFAEPEGWFRGANLLRSKLPIVAQDLVRKLRRKMGE